MNYENEIWKNRSDGSIAHGALTNSKRSQSFVEGVYPTHISHAYRCYLSDVDNRTYIDFICGLGTNYYGYANQYICSSVHQAMSTGGSVYSLASTEEVEFAEEMRGTFPFLEKVRFLKTGSEGCVAAIKIARAFTGKMNVYSEGYHGWMDNFVQLTPPANGVSKDNETFLLHNMDRSNSNVWRYTAAIIIEPIITDFSKERIEWLQKLREDCTKHGVILIFDETITAVRYLKKTVAQTYNILPDLWIGGKALCGGLPMSVIGGRADVMEADYFISSTWAGDRLACAAGMKALSLSNGDYKSEDLWAAGKVFQEEFNAISSHVQIVGYPTRGVFKYLKVKSQFKSLFMQEMCKARVLIGPSWFYNRWLTHERENVINIAKSVIKKILDNKATLQGKPPQSAFAEIVRK